MRETRTCTFNASGFRQKDFDHFCKVLQAMGVDLLVEPSASGKTLVVTATVPADVYDAEVKRTRNAGRRKSQILRLPESSPFTIDTPITEFLEWQESHTAKEGQEALGLKPATYFRRLKDMREKAEWERVHNPQRKKKDMKELHHTLGNL